jgi:thiol-disulfide isomerase/thioredoxin
MLNSRTVGRRLAASVVALAFIGSASIAGAQNQPQNLIRSVRAAIAANDFAGAEQLIAVERQKSGVTPDVLEAMSWLGRGALALKQLDKADAYARQAYDLSTAALKDRPVDAEPHLPIALGAAIEVRAQVAAQQGARSEAVAVLQRELTRYRDTSMAMRIQKNINLLSLEGTPAPALDLSESLAPQPLSLDAVKGKVVVLFFWAHWCPDCKNQAPILGDLQARYGRDGLTVIAPTQRYGYVARGREAGAREENAYIEQVRAQYYGFLDPKTVTLSTANHMRYGVSTTPTLVVVDRRGVVRAYHPGNMTREELDPLITKLLAEQPAGETR